jgi:DNA-directed RNA polymerase specialized sigma24 family protein
VEDPPPKNGYRLLLERLAAEPALRESKLVQLRRALLILLRHRGYSEAEDIVQDTLDAVAADLEHNKEIRSIEAYVRKVALNVAFGRSRKATRERALHVSDLPMYAPVDDEHTALECLEKCLAELDRDDRDLVLAYHDVASGRHIATERRQIAARHGLSMNALYIRISKLCDRLDDCTQRCLKRASK